MFAALAGEFGAVGYQQDYECKEKPVDDLLKCRNF